MHVDELRPEREEHLSLTMLPLDVLHTILLQRGIGARELCALESTCLMFRQLVDEAAWQHAFVQRRRVNVLRAPQGWKQELSRREMWSRDWRQLVGCSSPTQVRLGLPTQKLRRLAAKMFYGCEGSSSSVASAGPRPHRHDTHAVDPSGRIPKSFATIGAALAHAKPYDLVLVEPGEYREQIKLDRHAQVIGNGPPGSVVIIGVDGPAVEATGRTASRVSNLVIKQMARAGGGAMSGAVLIKGGAPARDGSAARPSSLGGGRSYPWPWRPRACPEPLAANAASRPLLLPTPQPYRHSPCRRRRPGRGVADLERRRPLRRDPGRRLVRVHPAQRSRQRARRGRARVRQRARRRRGQRHLLERPRRRRHPLRRRPARLPQQDPRGQG